MDNPEQFELPSFEGWKIPAIKAEVNRLVDKAYRIKNKRERGRVVTTMSLQSLGLEDSEIALLVSRTMLLRVQHHINNGGTKCENTSG